jgi:hypothetical protein
MGDRGAIKVTTKLGGVTKRAIWLYTHWYGSELDQIVINAISRRQRWDDEAYLTRIIFCEMLKMGHREDPEKALNGETGFGIMMECPFDIEHPAVVVDVVKQVVFKAKQRTTFDGGKDVTRMVEIPSTRKSFASIAMQAEKKAMEAVANGRP